MIRAPRGQAFTRDDAGSTFSPTSTRGCVTVGMRRCVFRCERDAAFLHPCGVSRDDAAQTGDTIPMVREKDERAHGAYCTKRVIREIYDAMPCAIGTRRRFVSDGSRAGPANPRTTGSPTRVSARPSRGGRAARRRRTSTGGP